jgi:hypothetical protein
MALAGGVHWALEVGAAPATSATEVQPVMAVPLSVKETVPVGVAPDPLVGRTVAVYVTGAARAEPDGAEEETVVVDAVGPTAPAGVATAASAPIEPISRIVARAALPPVRFDLGDAIDGSCGLRFDA